jgi:hypothetical protein
MSNVVLTGSRGDRQTRRNTIMHALQYPRTLQLAFTIRVLQTRRV